MRTWALLLLLLFLFPAVRAWDNCGEFTTIESGLYTGGVVSWTWTIPSVIKLQTWVNIAEQEGQSVGRVDISFPDGTSAETSDGRHIEFDRTNMTAGDIPSSFQISTLGIAQTGLQQFSIGIRYTECSNFS